MSVREGPRTHQERRGAANGVTRFCGLTSFLNIFLGGETQREGGGGGGWCFFFFFFLSCF